MFRREIVCSVLIILALAGCQGLAGEPQIVATLPPRPTALPISLPQQPLDLAQGAQIYAENCTRCHGISGAGDGELVLSGEVTQIMDFTDPTTMSAVSPEEYFRIITEGRLETLMPPWGESLSEDARWSVALYVYTLPVTQALLAEGEQLWQAHCAECHAADGSGTADGAPLPNLLRVSNDQARATIANGIENQMTAFADTLTPEQITAVTAYARSLSLDNPEAAPLVAEADVAEPAETPEAIEPAEADEAAPLGVVRGSVSNGTADAAIPADLELVLHVVDNEFNENTFETTVDASGAFAFEDVPMRSDRQYAVTAEYNGVLFVSEIVPVEADTTALDLPITVYEVGAEADDIQIENMMMQVGVTQGTLQMVQLVSFTNTSDRVYIQRDDSGQRSVSVHVPQGAQYHDFMGGGYTVSEDGTQVFDVSPVVPGQPHMMHLTYMLPYPENASVSVEQMLDYSLAGQVEVLVATEGLAVVSDQLSAQAPRTMGGRAIPSYGGELDLAADEPVSYAISGAPIAAATTATAAASGQAVSPLGYGLIVIGLSGLVVASFLYVRERRAVKTVSHDAPPASANDLMKQIAELDVEHRAGKINDRDYEQRRAALKAVLTAIMKNQGQKS